MGRKSKLPVVLEFNAEINTEVIPNYDLPKLVNYVDVPHNREKEFSLTRVFLKDATTKDIESTLKIRAKLGKENITVISARMPYMNGGNKVTTTIYKFCIDSGLSDSFATSIVRLYIKYLRGKQLACDSISDKLRAMRGFVDFIVSVREDPQDLTLCDLDRDLWLQFLEHIELNNKKPETAFNDVRSIFNNYEPTNLNGWLSHIKVAARKIKPSAEHTSELADSSYSDAVMYQILAVCLAGFQRRIGYLKRYESLTFEDMPSDWLYPGRDNKKPAEILSIRRNAKGNRYETESYRLLFRWLNSADEGYQVLIDHFLVHHKAGIITRSYKKYKGGIAGSLQGLAQREEIRPLLEQFYKVTATWHGFTYPTNGRTIWQYYLKKKSANEINIVINQIAWCLVNILMMQTGINKEVALSIPSLGEDGRSILQRGDPLFISGNGEKTETELFGFKERGGRRRSKIQFAIVRDGLHPLC